MLQCRLALDSHRASVLGLLSRYRGETESIDDNMRRSHPEAYLVRALGVSPSVHLRNMPLGGIRTKQGLPAQEVCQAYTLLAGV